MNLPEMIIKDLSKDAKLLVDEFVRGAVKVLESGSSEEQVFNDYLTIGVDKMRKQGIHLSSAFILIIASFAEATIRLAKLEQKK